MNPSIPVDQLTYEQAFDELEKIITALESNQHSLEESVALFERGQALTARCAALLDQAELKIRSLTDLGSDGLASDDETE